MKRVVFAAVVLAATSGTAAAGGFIGVGIGPGAGTSGDASFDANGRSGRLELGYSFGRIAVEGLASKFGLVENAHDYSDVSLGIAGMYSLPLSDGFSGYGRLGYQHSSLDSQTYPLPSYNGSGLMFGGGFQLKLPLAVTDLSIFVDYTIAHSSLEQEGTGATGGFTTRLWTLGAKLGF